MPQMSPMNWMYLSILTLSLMKINTLLNPHMSLKKPKTCKKIIRMKKWAW